MPSSSHRYTLTEHESPSCPGMVTSRAFSGATLEARIRQHQGVVFDDYAKAEEAADAINDAAAGDGVGVLPDLENGAHLTGFTKKVRIEGLRLYIPIRQPAGSI